MAKNFLAGKTVENAKPVCTAENILEQQAVVDAVHVEDKLIRYIQAIVDATRKEDSFVLGASPRAVLHLLKASQAKAFMAGRDFVKPDEVKAVAVNVLQHRMRLTSEAKIKSVDMDKLLQGIIVQVMVPVV